LNGAHLFGEVIYIASKRLLFNKGRLNA